MDLPGAGYFYTLAQVGITFAGFAALLMAITQMRSFQMSKFHLWVTRAYVQSGLVTAMQAMLAHADLVVTARIAGRIVGVSRAITDFAYCTYLSDLAVDAAEQRRGIGRELLRRTHDAAGLHTTLILLAAPAAESYYPHIGMTEHPSCWTINRVPQT